MAEILLIRSLQRRVAVVSSLAVGTALVLGIQGAHLAEDKEARQNLDAHLAEAAQTVIEFSRADVQRALASKNVTLQTYTPPDANLDLTFQVWLKDSGTLLKTNDVTLQAPLMPIHLVGFETGTINDVPVRKFSMISPDRKYVVQAAEIIEDHSTDWPTMLRYYFLPIALPLLASMLATWALQRRSVEALDALVSRLRDIDLNNMGEVKLDRTTHEIEPVIEEVNTLFQKASNAIITEQRFTSLAAHELRTPWAGIKAQAQLALKAKNDPDLREALQAIIHGVNRASHVFDQLFDLTRLESTSRHIRAQFQPVNLSLVMQLIEDDMRGKLRDKNAHLNCRLQVTEVLGLESALYLMLRNLVANATLYGPEGGVIEVSTELQGADVVLRVDDAGPGIPPDSRDSAFERFNRLNQNGPDGVGLGLSIVKKTVELHEGRIHLDQSPQGGLRVEISLPRHG